MAAIILVESSGWGFVDGNLIIRLEAHYFNSLTDKKYTDYFSYDHPKVWENQKFRTSLKGKWQYIHTNQNSNYAAFNFAKGLNSEAAYESISMGMGQKMGEYYATAGYKSAKEMFDDFSKGN